MRLISKRPNHPMSDKDKTQIRDESSGPVLAD
jgi:hypothetical protein